MGEGGEIEDCKENYNDMQNTDVNLTFNKYDTVKNDFKETVIDNVKSVREPISIKVSIPLNKLIKRYKTPANNDSGKETANKSLDFGNNKMVNRSPLLDINSSAIYNLERKDSLKSFNPPSSHAPEKQMNETGRVNSKVTQENDSTLFLSEEQKRMTKSIASAILKMYNHNDINNSLGNMTLKDILNVYSASSDLTPGHSWINKPENNNMDAKKAFPISPLPLQNMSRLENIPTHGGNKISKSNGNCLVPYEEQNRRHESVSSLALSMYDKNYICNNSGANQFNNVHPDLGFNNKLSKDSSNLNLSMVKNMNITKSYENRYSPPLYLEKKSFVTDSNHGALNVNSSDYNSLLSEELSLGNKTLSSYMIRMDEKSNIENFDKTLVPVSLGTTSQGKTSVLSDLENYVNTLELKTLKAKTSEKVYSSSSEVSESSDGDDNLSLNARSSSSDACESNDCDDNLSLNITSSSSVISEHSISDEVSVPIDYSLPRNHETKNFKHDFDIDRIQDCVSYEPVRSKQPNTKFQSRYKKRVKTARQLKDEQMEKRRMELEKEREDLILQVRHLEMMTELYGKIASKLNLTERQQK